MKPSEKIADQLKPCMAAIRTAYEGNSSSACPPVLFGQPQTSTVMIEPEGQFRTLDCFTAIDQCGSERLPGPTFPSIEKDAVGSRSAKVRTTGRITWLTRASRTCHPLVLGGEDHARTQNRSRHHEPQSHKHKHSRNICSTRACSNRRAQQGYQ